MSTKASTVDYLIEQGSGTARLTAKKMFGEYALYRGDKLVALVCDDQLFVKPTDVGRHHIGEATEAAPYPGAKPSLLVTGDRWDDGEWLSHLFKVTAEALPAPIRKKKR